MKLPPAHAIHDAVSGIYDLLSTIRIESQKADLDTGDFPTEARALAFIGLQNNLGAALSAFRAEIDGAKQ